MKRIVLFLLIVIVTISIIVIILFARLFNDIIILQGSISWYQDQILLFSYISIITMLFQAILALYCYRKNCNHTVSTIVVIAPMVIAILLLLNTEFPKITCMPAHKNQQQSPLFSPSGNYKMVMNEKGNRWIVNIYNHNALEYFDNVSDFNGSLNVYWNWDNKDRLWLYDTDTSSVFFWRKEHGDWKKNFWGYQHKKMIDENLLPPSTIYPL